MSLLYTHSLMAAAVPRQVTSVSVSTGPVGGGIRVTLTGFGFGLSDTDPTAKIGGEACAATQWTSDSSLSCTTPAGRGRGRPVAVAVGGQASEKLKTTPLFNYEGPSISAAFPHSSPTAGGARITLYSREFSGVPRGEALRGCPPPRTKWTRRVPHPVLIGHAASLSQVGRRCAGRQGLCVRGRRVGVGVGRVMHDATGRRGGAGRDCLRKGAGRRRQGVCGVLPPPPSPVLIEHVSSLTPY